MSPARISLEAVRGPIVAIGGAEDKIRERVVLSQLVDMAGGRRAVIAVFPAASTIPQETARTYTEVFRELGTEQIEVFQFDNREQANHADTLDRLERATLVFFTGGDQLRLVAQLGGTHVVTTIRRMNARGVPVAGTSAGAGALCQHMIARGKSGMVLGRHMVSLAAGLGLTNRIIVDQHFSQRHRMGRLFSAVSLNPFLIGVGIDEDTAAFLGPENRIHVWGRGAVTVVDGASLNWTNVHEIEGRNPAAVLGLQVHVLTAGCTYDLFTRKAHPPEALPPPPALALAAG
ncbi:MAG: Cyanophycinase [Myxococcota bacterium]|nr:Cyanophycinase [Myxococcota bacterium]